MTGEPKWKNDIEPWFIESDSKYHLDLPRTLYENLRQ